VEVFANALLAIPKTLAENSGFDVQDTILKLTDASLRDPNSPVGVDILTGDCINPSAMG
jgi:T-complex protein 1 subunit zeta